MSKRRNSESLYAVSIHLRLIFCFIHVLCIETNKHLAAHDLDDTKPIKRQTNVINKPSFMQHLYLHWIWLFLACISSLFCYVKPIPILIILNPTFILLFFTTNPIKILIVIDFMIATGVLTLSTFAAMFSYLENYSILIAFIVVLLQLIGYCLYVAYMAVLKYFFMHVLNYFFLFCNINVRKCDRFIPCQYACIKKTKQKKNN